MMKKEYIYKNYKWLFLSILLAFLDISVKYWVKVCLPIEEVLPILPGLNFYYVRNVGLAFGLFSNLSICYPWIFLWIVALIIITFIIMLYRSMQHSFYHNLPYIMIIGGALGNLYDRVLCGSVIDFIDLYVGVWHWPVFNIADIEICTGIMMLIQRYYCEFKKLFEIT